MSKKSREPLRVKISDAKARFSHFLKAAESGQEVIVTDRNRPVAKIVPVTTGPGAVETLAARKSIAESWNKPVPPATKNARSLSLELLVEDRESRG